MPCASFFVVCQQIDIIEFTGPGVWSVSDKRQFVGKRQKIKGRASKVSCSAQKVVGNTWRPWGRFVKNAQFHPTKHLSRWVPELEAERYSTPSIFSAHRNFWLFCSRWPSYLRNDQYNVPTGTRRSAVKKNKTGRIFGQKDTPSRKWIFAEISASFWQVRYGKKSGWPRKKRVYVFDVFDVFACLRFSLKRIFIINVSDVFDVFSVFSISPPKNWGPCLMCLVCLDFFSKI